MQNYIINYTNENEFKKLEKSLKKYNMLAYKKLNFDYYPSFRSGKFLGKLIKNENDIEKYELKLPSDEIFDKIYGETKLIYSVNKKDKTIILENITPSEILLEGHRSELTAYKGVMISKSNSAKDMFKIDLLNKLQDRNN